MGGLFHDYQINQLVFILVVIPHAHVFFSEQDYQCYLDALEEVAGKYDYRIHSYVLMTNHVYMLITQRLVTVSHR